MPTPSSSTATVGELRILRTRLGRLIRDIRRKIAAGSTSRRRSKPRSRAPARSARSSSASAAGSCIPSMPPRSSASARARPARPTSSASRPRSSPPTPVPPAASSCCTPRRCRAILTTVTPCGDVIEDTQKLTGCEIERAYVDKGYRGHDAQNPRRVFISGQKRGVFGVIKRELRRRSAIEPVIGHMKAEGHLGRCYLKGRAGDAANAILTAVGYNFRRILAWLRALLRQIPDRNTARLHCPISAQSGLLTADCPTADTAVGSIECSSPRISGQPSSCGQSHAVAGADRMQRAIRIDLSAATLDDNLSADDHRRQGACMPASGTGERPCPVKVVAFLPGRGARRFFRGSRRFIPRRGKE